MKKYLSLLLSLLMIASMIVPAAAADKSDIVVLFTGDVHCGVEDHIGYAGLAAYAKDLRSHGDTVVLADGGDAISGGAMGTLSEGAFPVDLMNYVGYDFAVPGVHEFDYGMERFQALAGRAEFEGLACNFISLTTGEPVFRPYRMVSYGGYQVAYIGIASPLTPSLAAPGLFDNAAGDPVYSFCAGDNGKTLYTAVQNAVNAARAAGADKIIALSHLGTDAAPYRSYDVIANTTGIDAMLDARSHQEVIGELVADRNGNSVLLSSPGEKLEYASVLRIKPSNGGISSSLLTASYEKKDADTERYIDELEKKYSGLVTDVVGKTDFPLVLSVPGEPLHTITRGETNLGDFCADAFRVSTGADAAILTGGSVRASIPAGTITNAVLMDVFPQGDRLCVAEVSGRKLLEALECGAERYPEGGSLLQVSGLSYDLHSEIPSPVVRDSAHLFVSLSGRNRIQNVKIGGRALDPDRLYKIAMTETLCMDPVFSALRGCTVLNRELGTDQLSLMRYLSETLDGRVPSDYRAAGGQKRIRIETNDADHFEDIEIGGWSYEAIAELIRKGIMSGVGALFRPQEIVTRAMMVQMIYNAEKADPNGDTSVSGTVSFSDVPADAWYGEAVRWAASKNIVVGTDGKFRPDAFITRQEMAVMLYRYAQYKGRNVSVLPSFSFDVQFKDGGVVAEWAVDAMGFCSVHGIIRGSLGGMLRPGAYCSRQEAAVMLSRFLAPDA